MWTAVLQLCMTVLSSAALLFEMVLIVVSVVGTMTGFGRRTEAWRMLLTLSMPLSVLP